MTSRGKNAFLFTPERRQNNSPRLIETNRGLPSPHITNLSPYLDFTMASHAGDLQSGCSTIANLGFPRPFLRYEPIEN